MEQQFKEIFGFEAAAPEHKARKAQQIVVDAILHHLSSITCGAQDTVKELGRRLQQGFGDSLSVTSFAAGMEVNEAQADVARTSFKQASELAKGAGFAVLGVLKDYKVQEVFGLKCYHAPLGEAELARVKSVLRALAVEYQTAQDKAEDGRKNLPRTPTQDEIDSYQALKDKIETWRARFWEAHGLAKGLGVKVGENYTDQLPPNWRYFTPREKADHIQRARRTLDILS